jgi:hypothetical protein
MIGSNWICEGKCFFSDEAGDGRAVAPDWPLRGWDGSFDPPLTRLSEKLLRLGEGPKHDIVVIAEMPDHARPCQTRPAQASQGFLFVSVRLCCALLCSAVLCWTYVLTKHHLSKSFSDGCGISISNNASPLRREVSAVSVCQALSKPKAHHPHCQAICQLSPKP